MTTDLVEKCHDALTEELNRQTRGNFGYPVGNIKGRPLVLAVIDALADGVSDEMVQAFRNAMEPYTDGSGWHYDRAIAAAIRAAESREG